MEKPRRTLFELKETLLATMWELIHSYGPEGMWAIEQVLSEIRGKKAA